MQTRTVQCLLLGRFTSANAYALEALLLHLQSCFLTDSNSQVQLWFKMGTVVQLAFRMGYHRDPSKLPDVSCFDGEMRRRVWLNIYQLDALGSFQVGFPKMIASENCDAEVPGNYEWSDLEVDMTTLPPPRPMTHNTPVRYTIAKAPIMEVFKKIIAHTQMLIPATYDKTITLDFEMREAIGNLPDSFKPRDVSQAIMDDSTLIWGRINVELLSYKGIIVLHRRYLKHEFRVPKYETSRKYCVEAALSTLARQADISEATKPGGRLYEDRWRMNSLTTQDFLLAAMVICLDLSVRAGVKTGKHKHEKLPDDDLVAKEYLALQVSHGIWAAGAAFSPEANIAARATEVMMKTIPGHHVAACARENPTYFESTQPAELPYAEPMMEMIDGSEAIDWVSLSTLESDGFELMLSSRFLINTSRTPIWILRAWRSGRRVRTRCLISSIWTDYASRRLTLKEMPKSLRYVPSVSIRNTLRDSCRPYRSLV
jgi:hypothetical protein